MDDYDEDIDRELDDIISQIKNQNKEAFQEPTKYPELTKDGVDDFILTSTARLITDMLNAVDIAKRCVNTPEEMSAFATLAKSVASAIELLQKRVIADNKNKTQKEVTQMNIESKVSGAGQGNALELSFSREEILAAIMDKNSKKEPEKIDPPTVDV